MNDIVIRELLGLAELSQTEALQKRIWGADERTDPGDLMLPLQYEGALIAGAFDGPEMVAMLFAFPTRAAHVQHSHRMGVDPRYRAQGLAEKLKWFQRSWCLERGITLVRWTYDPLRAINARLNISKLGGSAGTYFIDYYGAMPGINAGLPSDRLLAEWTLDDPAVVARAEGRLPTATDDATTRNVPIPADLDALLASDPAAALDWRLKVRVALTELFGQGYRVTGFDAEKRAYRLQPR